jgi:hypothetical protein
MNNTNNNPATINTSYILNDLTNKENGHSFVFGITKRSRKYNCYFEIPYHYNNNDMYLLLPPEMRDAGQPFLPNVNRDR